MKLSEISCSNWVCESNPLEQIEFSSIAFDSRQVRPGSLFVAIKGHDSDGHLYLDEAIEKGAAAVLVEQNTPRVSIPMIKVPSTRRALSRIASHYYKHPSLDLVLFGITGTNGKTTTAYLLSHLTKCLNLSFGTLGTIQYDLLGKKVLSSRTTPDPLLLENLLSEIRNEKGTGAILEVSSHALDQERVNQLHFDGVVFTNLSQDHLDYHENMEAYFQSKKRLFDEVLVQSQKEKKWSVINIDDPYGERLFQEIEGEKISFGFSKKAQFRATEIKSDLKGSRFILETPNQTLPVNFSLIGEHNIYNFLGAIACLNQYITDLSFLNKPVTVTVPGRLERFEVKGRAPVFIDYAHTPDALKQALKTLKPFVSGKLILVFGCGGDRDKGKRSKMGAIAESLADEVILTNDNPRGENPQAIIKEIQSGFSSDFTRFSVEEDRRQAIQNAILQASEEDVVLVAGKGHELEQIFENVTEHFSDQEVVEGVLNVDL